MKSDRIPPLYDKKEQCPACEKFFTTKKIRSRFIKLDHKDTDFCPYYKDETLNPLLYFIKVCPSCGYAYSDQFTSYFFEGTKAMIQQKVSEKWVPHSYGEERTIPQAIQTYKLAIYCATIKKEKSIVLASLLLRLTWLYRKFGDTDQEKRFMKLALQHLNNAYVEDNYANTDMSGLRVLYLIAELNRRLGNYEVAVSYFSKVVDKKDEAIEPKMIHLAREQWYVTREEMKQSTPENN